MDQGGADLLERYIQMRAALESFEHEHLAFLVKKKIFNIVLLLLSTIVLLLLSTTSFSPLLPQKNHDVNVTPFPFAPLQPTKAH